MLWIGLILGIIFVISGCIFTYVQNNTKYSVDVFEAICYTIGAFLSFVCLIVIIFMGMDYNEIKTTSDAQITVLEERNDIVLAQIEPLVKKYLEYESDTYAKFKPDAQTLIALSAYPELKGNEFVQTQIKVILHNQNEITNIKLKKAKLKSYRLWLFME